MRVLGVDFGSKRIGIAIGGDDPPIVSARPFLKPTGSLKGDAASLCKLAREWGVDAVVVGIPFHELDRRMERICLKLAEEIRQLGETVFEVDESMTSLTAESNVRELAETSAARSRLLDGEAARLIVERYFEQKTN